MDCLLCHAALQQNGKNAVGMRLYLFPPHDKSRKRGWRKDGGDKSGFDYMAKISYILCKCVVKLTCKLHGLMLICTWQLVFWADWHLVKMRYLRKSWSVPEACRVLRVEGRDSHFLSGPNLKKGQIQSNINHFALRSFRCTIVIEQTSGKRPVAGGNKKLFDNYKVRFLPRSPQHLHKPERAMSGCQQQSGHIHTPIFSQRDSHMYTQTWTHVSVAEVAARNTQKQRWCCHWLHRETDAEPDRWTDSHSYFSLFQMNM